MRAIKRLVLLQLAEEITPHAHHRAQAVVAKAIHYDFREPTALPLLGTYIKLLALVDVD
jgi:hypothetical protein